MPAAAGSLLVQPRRPIAVALETAQRLALVAERNRYANVRLLPPQAEFLAGPEQFRLLRTGNQIGKTFAACYYAIGRCIGDTRAITRREREPPAIGFFVCASWPQSLEIMRKFWDMCPKDALDPVTSYSYKNGFTGRTVVFKNGSIVRFRTMGQDTLDLSGATLDFAIVDEPPKNPRIVAELMARLIRRGGTLILTMTPINAGPLDWLRELIKTGKIADYHYRCTPEMFIPVGQTLPLQLDDANRTPMDRAYIADLENKALSHEMEVVVHGEFGSQTHDRVFRRFWVNGPQSCVSDEIPECDVDLRLGIDWGSGRNFSNFAVLAAVSREPIPRIWVLDEAVSDGETTQAQDAQSILAMLARWQLRWEELASAYGDRAWSDGQRKFRRKSNEQAERALCALRGMAGPEFLQPRLLTVKRGHNAIGSVSIGCRFLHLAQLRGGFKIRPRCVRTIECLSKWAWGDDEFKHGADALRYTLAEQIWAFESATVPADLALYR